VKIHTTLKIFHFMVHRQLSTLSHSCKSRWSVNYN